MNTFFPGREIIESGRADTDISINGDLIVCFIQPTPPG